MKAFTAILFLAPALALAHPAHHEILISTNDGPQDSDRYSLAEIAYTVNKLLVFENSKPSKTLACCNETPCFIGCPWEGAFRVSIVSVRWLVFCSSNYVIDRLAVK
jgi:hypothetical protein